MSFEPSNRLFIFKKDNEVKANSVNYNFRFLYDYLSAISTDRALISELARSTVLADLIAQALLEVDNSLIELLAEELSAQSDFYTSLVSAMAIDSAFLQSIVNFMEIDNSFLDALADALNADTDFVNNISDNLAEDTRGVNTRTDISGYTQTLGGELSYLATDSGTLRVRKSDATSVAASDYASNATYEVDGSFWVVDVNVDANTYLVYRYDTETDYQTKHPALKDDYLAGPEGTVGQLFTSIQFLDTTTSLNKSNGNTDKTTGRIYQYGYSAWDEDTVLPVGFEKVYSISLKVKSTSISERFTFETFNVNVSDNGFITNVAHAMVANDNLAYEIADKVVENPRFVTELSQNLQKVTIEIATEIIGGAVASGNYHDDVLDIDKSDGQVLNDYNLRYSLTPRLSEDTSGNLSIVSEPWIISSIRCMPYLDTSGIDVGIVGVGVDVSGGAYLDLLSVPAANIGHAVSTYNSDASSVAYVRAKSAERIFLTNNNNSLQVVDSFARLGWTTPVSGDVMRQLDTLNNIDTNFDVKIYRKNDWSEKSYQATNNIAPLDDLRQFNYRSNENGKLFLEISNNLENGNGSVEKYNISILGYRLIDNDIILTPGLNPHDHFKEEFSADSVTTVFATTYDFILGSTQVVQQHYPLRVDYDYTENSTSGVYANGVTFAVAPSGDEWVSIDYMRGPS